MPSTKKIPPSSQCLTHSSGEMQKLTSAEMQPFFRHLETIEDRALPLEEEKRLLQELNKFDLGRFLLRNRGINGYWTAYWLIHGPQKQLANPLERWLIHEAPAFQGSRERFKIFQHELSQHISAHKKFASVPCGLMDDLLQVNYKGLPGIELTGIDVDLHSLQLAKINARKLNPATLTSFLQKDALELGFSERFHLITSNGLNFYEPNDVKVVKLYENFYQALLPKGVLITSFLTPSPSMSAESPWRNFDAEAAQKQKALFADILAMKWQVFRTEAQTRDHLQKAGFRDIRFRYDSQGMFPTVIASKV